MNVIAFHQPFSYCQTKGVRIRTFRAYSKRPGVYMIKHMGEIVYVGMSASCVVAACYRHFYHWKESYTSAGMIHRRVTYLLHHDQYEVCIIETTREQAHSLERALIFSLNPRDNAEKYDYFYKQVAELVNADPVEAKEMDDLPF